jgi:transposase-like protein
MNGFKNLHDLLSHLPDENSCRLYFERFRWEDGKPICPYCGSGRHYRIENGRRFKCGNPDCHKKYSVLVGTVMEDTKIPLQKWFIALYILTAHKKGVSSCQLGRDLGISQKSAWHMLHRLREMAREKAPLVLSKDVQADEVYIGGLEENKHKDKKAKNAIEASALKMPVVGLLETGGRIVLKVMPWVTKATISDFVLNHVEKNSIFVTDGGSWYAKVGKKMDHIVVDTAVSHKKDGKHKNGVENAWNGLRKCIEGIYHQVSDKHLQRYCDEFQYRFNSRKIQDGERFRQSLERTQGYLPWKELTTKSLTSWEYGKEVAEIPEE